MALKSIIVEDKNFDISYEIVNKEASKDLIILHGWGVNKELMKNIFSSTLEDYRHIYIDLPGFGKSSNDYILDVYLYTKIIDEFLKICKFSKFAIMGHSYGGKVATLLNPTNLILLSSAGIIEEKSLNVKCKIKLSKLFSLLGLKKLTKIFRSNDVQAMSENMYETFKNAISENLEEEFKSYSGKALIFWGKKDTATSLSSGEKISKLIKNSSFKAYEGDHFFFAKHKEDIEKEIKNAIL